MLRRSVTKPDATFGIVAEIAALRLPWIAMQILPFAVLLGGILAFWRLTRSSELIVARAGGVSAWQFLAAPVLCAVALGAFATAAVSPISAVMRARAEALDNAYLRTGGGPLALNGGQLWLRQSDAGFAAGGVAILHAPKRQRCSDGAAAGGRRQRLPRGLEGPLPRAHRGLATRASATAMDAGRRAHHHARPPAEPRRARLILPTDLTVDRVQESFAPPDTFSVWALPGFISMLDRSGFSSIRHRLHFQTLLALPLLAGTMALLAAGLLDAPGAARRRRADDRQRSRRRVRAVRGLEGRRGIRPVRRAAAAPCRLGARRVRA